MSRLSQLPDPEPGQSYDITRSQAFGPNRRYVQEQIEEIVHQLRLAYRLSPRRGKESIAWAAGSLKLLSSRFDI